jgi:hypothetical protein
MHHWRSKKIEFSFKERGEKKEFEKKNQIDNLIAAKVTTRLDNTKEFLVAGNLNDICHHTHTHTHTP